MAEKVLKELREVLEQSGIKADVAGREKTPYSIWRKMQRKNVAFEQLSDIMAFRIMVDSIEQCYQALGIYSHSRYHVVPGRFKDLHPRRRSRNKYQSLHTSVHHWTREAAHLKSRSAQPRCMKVAELWRRRALGFYKNSEQRTDGLQYRWLQGSLISSGMPKAGRIPRKHQARVVSRSGLLFFAEGRPCRASTSVGLHR